MAVIDVICMDKNNFQVTVIDRSTTTHHVTVQDSYLQTLSADPVDPAYLVKKSFEFLLARESNTSILRHFDLSVIAHYFPEYEQTICKNNGFVI